MRENWHCWIQPKISASLKRRRPSARAGIMLPLAIFASLAIGFLAYFLNTMNQSYRNQINHFNKHQITFMIAYSAFSKILAKVQNAPWSERFFKTRAVRENQIALFGGEYDSYVENSTKEYQADIYIQSQYGGYTCLYFWRIVYNDSVLDISNRIQTIFFGAFSPDNFPSDKPRGINDATFTTGTGTGGNNNPGGNYSTGSASSTMAAKVDHIISERKRNNRQANEKAAYIAISDRLQEIVNLLSGRPKDAPNVPSTPEGTAEPPPLSRYSKDPLSTKSDDGGIPTPSSGGAFATLKMGPYVPQQLPWNVFLHTNAGYDPGNTGYGDHWRVGYPMGVIELGFTGKYAFNMSALGTPENGKSNCYVNIFVNGKIYETNKHIDNSNAFLDYEIPSSEFGSGANVVRIVRLAGSDLWLSEVTLIDDESQSNY